MELVRAHIFGRRLPLARDSGWRCAPLRLCSEERRVSGRHVGKSRGYTQLCPVLRVTMPLLLMRLTRYNLMLQPLKLLEEVERLSMS